MADDLLGHVDAILADPKAARSELRFAAARLAESLRDVRRVAESWGARLAAVDNAAEPEGVEQTKGGSNGPRLPAEAFG